MTIGKKITNIWTVALVAVGMGVLTSGPANADIGSFTYVNGADASIPTIDNSYTLELALNLGNGGAVTRDGITFTNIVHGAVSSPYTYGTWNGITVGMETGGDRDIAQAEISGADTLWEWFEYPAAGSGAYDITLTITNLQAANHYRIQILNGENRTSGTKQYNGTMTATDSTGANNATNLIYGEGGSATEYALTTLDVSNATWVNIHLDDDGGLAPTYSGIVIHSVNIDSPAVGGVVGVKTIELEVTGAIGDIKWQSSEDNSIWNDIVPEETGSTLDVTTLYPDTPWFRVEAITSVSTNYSTTMKVISRPQGTVILIH